MVLGAQETGRKARFGFDFDLAASLGVLAEQAHPAEGLLAMLARVLLRLQVGLEVSSQVGLVGEAPGAEPA